MTTLLDKVMKYKNPLVIYHANCADGYSAAWVFRHVSNLIEVDFDFHPGVYSETPPDCTDRTVYMVDFSYKRDVVIKMCEDALSVTLIDHHKTALDDLKELDDTYIEKNNFFSYTSLEHSGAVLAWNYWKKHNGLEGMGEMPVLLKHIEDRDLWLFKYANTREIIAAIFSYEYTWENWDKLMSYKDSELDSLVREGSAIERKHFKDITELLKVTQRMGMIGGIEIPVASLPYIFSSDAGHIMAEMYLGGKVFAACYWDTPKGRTFSLRSMSQGMDVSLIAKEYGGGGHKNAAGFSVPKEHILATHGLGLVKKETIVAGIEDGAFVIRSKKS
jgi:oligoribonuclease NrnB/cAMP/cGMP phosphodiesterase (DHH superfamily)